MDKTKLRKKFLAQRGHATKRKIPFLLTFDEWCEIWESSGLLHLRGRGPGKYCMARHGDAGAYEVGNVSIVTNHTNSMEQKRTGRNVGRPRTISGAARAPSISIRLPAEVAAKLEAMAAEKGRGRSDVLRDLIIHAIGR